MRLSRNRQKEWSGRSGAAIVELALAMMLMFGMLLFILFIGRFLSDRNRVLAASRTMAWIYAHQHEESAIDPASTRDMHLLIRRWHFKEGVAGGVVHLPSPRVGHSIWYQGGGGESPLAFLTGSTESLQSHRDQVDDASIGTEDDKTGDPKNAGDLMGTITAGLQTAFDSFIGGDFKYYEARVHYGMPLIFPRNAYAFLWGGTFREPADMGAEPILAEQTRAGESYFFLNPDATGYCVYPNLDASVDDAMGDLMDGLAGMMDMLMRRMKFVPPIYRPHTDRENPHDDDVTVEKTKNRLEALLIYEAPGYDPQQRYTRGVSEWWELFGAPRPWWLYYSENN